MQSELGPMVVQNLKIWNLKAGNCVIGNVAGLVEFLEEFCNSVRHRYVAFALPDSDNVRRHGLENLYHELM